MGEYSEVFVAFDVAKKKHPVAIAEGGRRGEIRFVGEIENSPATIERMIKKLAGRYECLHVCFDAGPTGYAWGNRRCAPVRSAATADVVSRPGAGRELDRRHGETRYPATVSETRLIRLLSAGWVPRSVFSPGSVYRLISSLVPPHR